VASRPQPRANDFSDPSIVNPLVSAVIPTHNRGPVVERAVTSALAQTYRPLEVVVVDDGSTDDTVRRLAKIRSQELRVISNRRNVGPAQARNDGLVRTSGSYVAFLDSDDVWEPWKIEAQVGSFRTGPPELGAVYSGRRINLPDGSRMDVRPKHRGDIYGALLRRNPVVLPTVMIRRAVLDDVGLFDPAMPACEDWELMLRIARRYTFDYVEGPAVVYDATGHDRMSARHRAVFLANHRIFRRYNPRPPSREVLASYLALQSRELLNTGRPLTAARYARRSLWLKFDRDEKLALQTIRQLFMRRPVGRALLKAYAWRKVFSRR
jgi:glycosyltransferase involved in cell wall biosynthesis